MKILKSIALLFIFAVFISCNSDDDNANMDNPDLVATWKLVKVTGGIGGINQDISQENNIWQFSQNGTVHIGNDATGQDYTGLATGTYNYTYVNGEASGMCAEVLKVGTAQLGCVTVTDGKLYISNNFVDGFTLEFEPAALAF
ncbi:hypothetical protein [Flavobacterium sp. 3HN19-14]|uniref:hypothetical protein n=1 Tax=Flavobacterium sp. 3HN19-14 TaxID=3448133 RepID=UPI003EE365D9